MPRFPIGRRLALSCSDVAAGNPCVPKPFVSCRGTFPNWICSGDRTMETTWKPHEKHGELTERSGLPDSVFAFPKQRKEPMTDASHVRNAIARFDQTVGVSDDDRKLAFA